MRERAEQAKVLSEIEADLAEVDKRIAALLDGFPARDTAPPPPPEPSPSDVILQTIAKNRAATVADLAMAVYGVDDAKARHNVRGLVWYLTKKAGRLSGSAGNWKVKKPA